MRTGERLNLLDRPAREVRADSGALDRMLSAAAGASGRPYIELLEDYSRQSDEWNGSAAKCSAAAVSNSRASART